MNKKLIQLLTLTALLIGASAHAMENPEEPGGQLCFAAANSDLKFVRLLLQRDAPVDAKGWWGQTPLMIAARYGRINVCQLLLAHKASVDAKDKDGWNPLMYAASYGHTDLCQLLLDHGASVDAKTRYGVTSLKLAANDGLTDRRHTNICHLLIDAIVKRIKESKANALILLGTKKNRRPQYLNDRENNSRIDKPVIELIAREVHKLALWQQQSLFAQINAIYNNELKQELLAYAREKLNTKSTSNQGNSDE